MNNNLLIDYAKLKVGQKLWDIREGEVEISTFIDENRYSIQASRNGTMYRAYTKDGKYTSDDKYPSLYLSNPFEQVNEFPKLMEVYLTNRQWVKRIIIHKNNKGYLALSKIDNLKSLENYEGNIYLNNYEFHEVREIQELQLIELSIEEIAKKLSIDPKLLRIKK